MIADADQSIRPELLEAIFDGVRDFAYWVKDPALRFTCASAAMVKLCGARDRFALLGKRAEEVLPGTTSSETLDRQTLRSARPIRDHLELLQAPSGDASWLLVNRWPVMTNGEATGVLGVARILPVRKSRLRVYARLADAVEHVRENLTRTVEVKTLARRAGVSVWQLEQDFMELFGMSPSRYIVTRRLDVAQDLLKAGATVAEVAYACGFSDQSSFARRFRSATGVSPSEFRRQA